MGNQSADLSAAMRVQRAFKLFAARRARDAVFGEAADGFGEPAWDMMLLLSAHDGAGRGLARDQLLDAAGVQRKISKRYLDWMTSRDLVVVEEEMGTIVVRLQEQGRALMRAYLDGEEG